MVITYYLNWMFRRKIRYGDVIKYVKYGESGGHWQNIIKESSMDFKGGQYYIYACVCVRALRCVCFFVHIYSPLYFWCWRLSGTSLLYKVLYVYLSTSASGEFTSRWHHKNLEPRRFWRRNRVDMKTFSTSQCWETQLSSGDHLM